MYSAIREYKGNMCLENIFEYIRIAAHKGAYLPRGIAIPMNLLLKPIFLGQLLEKLCKAHIDGQTKEESENYTLSSNPNMV